MKPIKIMRIIFIIIFITMIIVPLVCVNKNNNKISQAENRYLAKFPEIYDLSTGEITENLRGKIENWFNDNVGYREELLRLNANIKYKIFNTGPNEKVHIGKDGWMFYTQDNNLEIAKGQYPLTNDILEIIKEEQEFIQKSLADKGIEYILILTPSKSSIYPEKISGGEYTVRETAIDILANYLKKNTTINVINTKEGLLEATKEGKQVFYKTDTHWNEEGAYAAYQQIFNKLRGKYIMQGNMVNIQLKPSTYKGEFSGMMGDVSILEPEYMNSTEIIEKKAIQIEDMDIISFINREQNGHNHLLDGNHIYINNSLMNQGKRVLIYGDSFFGSWNMHELLAENFWETYFVWSDMIKESVVTKIKPDVVIFERTERYINTLIKEADSKLKYQELQNKLAEIIDYKILNEMLEGEKQNLKITVKNISGEVWNDERKIRLAIFENGQDRYRAQIPKNITVLPNEEYTFVLENYVGMNKDTVLEFQMVEEGITYFGEREKVTIKYIN